MAPELAFGLTVALAVVVGLSLGLLGGGGSILAVPLLVYVGGLGAKEAIATSLLVVGVTSVVGLVPHARAGRVRWRTGLLFGLAGMVGAYGGGRLGVLLPEVVLLVAFAVIMLATAVAMLRGQRAAQPRSGELPVLRVLLDGVVVGVITGLVGAGGGFLVVPALVLLGGVPMAAAVGTSLLVIGMKSAAGLAGYLSEVSLDWPLALSVTAAAVAGSLLGAQLAGRVPPDVLRRGFGWFVFVMGVVVLSQQLPAAVAGPVLAALLMVGVAVGGVVAVRRVRRVRTVDHGERAPSPQGALPEVRQAATGADGGTRPVARCANQADLAATGERPSR